MEAVAVYDCMGRMVFEQETTAVKTYDLNLSFLGSGNYIVEARSGKGVSRSKLVLVK